MEPFEKEFEFLSSLPKEELRKRYASKEIPWIWLKTMVDRKLISQAKFEYVVSIDL